MSKSLSPAKSSFKNLDHDIRNLIEKCKSDLARSVNSSLVLLHWKIGQRINQDILGPERNDYGKQVIEDLSLYRFS